MTIKVGPDYKIGTKVRATCEHSTYDGWLECPVNEIVRVVPGDEGTITDIEMYKFEEDGKVNYYAHIRYNINGFGWSVSTKPSRNIPPDFTKLFEIID